MTLPSSSMNSSLHFELLIARSENRISATERLPLTRGPAFNSNSSLKNHHSSLGVAARVHPFVRRKQKRRFNHATSRPNARYLGRLTIPWNSMTKSTMHRPIASPYLDINGSGILLSGTLTLDPSSSGPLLQ